MRTKVFPAMMAVVLGLGMTGSSFSFANPASNAQKSSLKKSPAHKGFLVRLKSGQVNARALTTLSAAGIQATSSIPQLGVVVVNELPEKLPLAAQALIEHVEPNYVVRAVMGKGKPYDELAQLWGFKSAKVKQAWEVTRGSKDVIVAVSDTGIWLDHVDLQGNLWVNPLEIAENGKDDDGNGYVDDVHGWNFESNNGNPTDDNIHGTHVAGTIGAVGDNSEGVVGVAQVSLMALRFLGMDGSGTLEDGIKTILYAADNGARVLNASWGGDGPSEELVRAIDYAKDRGMILVCASGNDSSNADKYPMYPAALESENIISVAALRDSTTLASFSNYGAKSVDIAAPGERIYSTIFPMNRYQIRHFYYELNGTSMAAPHVSGVLGLIYSANPSLSWQEAKQIILDSAAPIKSLAGKVLTGGALNAEEAVRKSVEQSRR